MENIVMDNQQKQATQKHTHFDLSEVRRLSLQVLSIMLKKNQNKNVLLWKILNAQISRKNIIVNPDVFITLLQQILTYSQIYFYIPH